jgi:dethiobiotin synthetase
MIESNDMSMTDLQHIVYNNAVFDTALNDTEWMIGIILFHGTWNTLPSTRINPFVSRLVDSALSKQGYQHCRIFGLSILVDRSDEDLAMYIGETQSIYSFSSVSTSELPILSIFLRMSDPVEGTIHHISSVSSLDIVQCLKMPFDSQQYMSKILRPVQRSIEDLETKFGLEIDYIKSSSDALRIFIAGDRSSVGKSSICLGIMGSLMASGYSPDTLAYIKPATQSESTQLIQLYCDQHGIACVPIGPLVYYRGFTRAFLAGEAGSTGEWLDRCGTAVDRIARGKRIVLVDGVGFPAVGSICGTSNAAVATACGYPIDIMGARRPMGVVLVGGSGVGAAVDAFNLNAAYFEQSSVPVMGGIFNKLPESGFYSLENCKEQISAYFRQSVEQVEKGRRPFGFVPLFPRIAGNFALTYVDEYIEIFRTHVDIDAIINAAQTQKESSSPLESDTGLQVPAAKRIKLLSSRPTHHISVASVRSRQEIETEAITAGAAPSA